MKLNMISSTASIVSKSYLKKMEHRQVPLDDTYYTFLKKNLPKIFEETLDPDVSDKDPELFINRLLTGHLGAQATLWTSYHHEQLIALAITTQSSLQTTNIVSLGVMKSYRGLAFATELLSYLCGQLYNEDIEQITLQVHEQNKPALALYKKLGFIPI